MITLCLFGGAFGVCLFAQGFDEPGNEPPVETPLGGNENASIEEIIKEPSKVYVGGGYAAHPVLMKHFTEQSYIYTGGIYNEESIRYRLLKPEKIEQGRLYPLVVWLHGAGESDDDNVRQLAHLHHILDFIAGGRKQDFYMLVTQCPKNNKSWTGSQSHEGKGDAPIVVTETIMRHLIDEYPINRDCVTVAGLSSGGSATWEFAARCNDIITAMAAFSSNPPSPSTQMKLKNVSIWLFNSSDDGGTPIANLRETTDRLKNQGYKIHLTEYPTSSHDSWGPALREDDAFAWLLAQRKGDWKSPPPGWASMSDMLKTYAAPLVVPLVILIIGGVIVLDRKVKGKRIAAIRNNIQTEMSDSDFNSTLET